MRVLFVMMMILCLSCVVVEKILGAQRRTPKLDFYPKQNTNASLSFLLDLSKTQPYIHTRKRSIIRASNPPLKEYI